MAKKTLRSDAAEAVARCAGWNARLAARLVTRFLDERLAPTGLGLAQFGLLAQVASAPDDSLAALARRAGLDPSTLTRNLQALAREGWVEIAADPADQRRRMAWLTEAGARRLEAALPVWAEAHAALEARLDADLAMRLRQAAEALSAPSPPAGFG